MQKKIRLGVLFGGRSCEHEVSVTAARSMLASVDPDKYDVTLIGIAKDGTWHVAADSQALPPGRSVGGGDLIPVLLDYCEGNALVARDAGADAAVPLLGQLDVVFPLLHGPFGEDGTIQGLLELAGLPYVGSGVVGSAVGMDKVMMKRAFRAEGLPLLPYLVATYAEVEDDVETLERRAADALGYPLFVKPASLGSSVGVHAVRDASAFARAIRDAAAYDEKILLEQAARNTREVECAVIGNDAPEASVLGEGEPADGFYDYNAKYVDDSAQLLVPAELPHAVARQVQALSIEAFRAVDAKGLARVDFFVSGDHEIFVNEINTMPGFTPISMYPRLWEASGLSYPELIDRLIELAFERHRASTRVRRAL